MNRLPTPPPDRRSLKASYTREEDLKSSNTKETNKENNIIQPFTLKKSLQTNSQLARDYLFSDPIEKEDSDTHPAYNTLNNLNLLKLKHIEDMRNHILTYKLLSDKKMFLSSVNSKIEINNCNVILFGPSGSGKSSFIKSLFRAVYGTPFLPPEAISKLIIKDTDENEGTLAFTRLHLKEESEQSSGVVFCDTRGHIWMNEEEKEQFKVIIEGKVKDNVEIMQNKQRNALLLWEFWKKDAELFPKEIFNGKESNLSSIPHSIVLVFDGSLDDIIDSNDEKFYRELVDISYLKGYNSVHVILTRIDLFEKNINEKYKHLGSTDRHSILNNQKDQKIEKVIDILGVKRSNVHFIENYHSDYDDNVIEIDYHALKTLTDFINLSEQFILTHINKNATCFAKCF